ncbi:MAG: 5'-methylthioadenosine phosphorylase, partial [Candidatus Thermoplasmatota archaeon]|nr:5'-methylthioadenosine phosphorylase [Candidatus Thermoplasmatota archaeon]
MRTMEKADLGIIYGTGYQGFSIFDEETMLELDTPFGPPSSHCRIGQINGFGVALLARHGKDHTIPPHMVNHRANIYGLKSLGCRAVLGIN